MMTVCLQSVEPGRCGREEVVGGAVKLAGRDGMDRAVAGGAGGASTCSGIIDRCRVGCGHGYMIGDNPHNGGATPLHRSLHVACRHGVILRW